MKRVKTGLTVVATGLIATVVFAGTAHADPARPPGVPANYVYYRDIPGSQGDCNSAGLYFQQQGLIKFFICDNIEPPTWETAGYSEMWVIFP